MGWIRQLFSRKSARVGDARTMEIGQKHASAKELPWVLDYCWNFSCDGNVLSSFMLRSSSTDLAHTTQNGLEEDDLCGAGICAAKDGWLLLQKGSKSFFFNPMSSEVIKLPEMDLNFNRATFSSIPTSADCLCFAIQSSKASDKIRVAVCSPGDKKWSTYLLDGFHKAVEDVVYSSGKFYCVFNGGVLGAFRISGRSWRLLTNKPPVHNIGSASSRSHILECSGELLLVWPSVPLNIFRFDRTSKVWKRKNTLGNHALFLGCTSFSIAAEGAASHMAEQIFYNDNASTWCYSLKAQQGYRRPVEYPWIIKHNNERVWINYTPEKAFQDLGYGKNVFG